MEKEHSLTRRNFLKKGAMVTALGAACTNMGSGLQSCNLGKGI